MLLVSSNRCRLGKFVLLFVLSGQLAFLTHAVATDHQIGEVCEICVGSERLSDGLIESTEALVVAVAFVLGAAFTASLILESFTGTVRSRSPPRL